MKKRREDLSDRQLLKALRSSDNERDGLELLAEVVKRFEAAIADGPAPLSLDQTPKPRA